MPYAWPGVRVLHLPKTERCKLLAARWAFYAGDQHDHKTYDFAGRARKGRNLYVLERLLKLGFEPVHPPAMAEREPDCPVPLARQIIDGFTQMVFPRFLAPTLEVPADPRTARFQAAVFDRSHTWWSLMAARTIAGAVGEAAVRIFVVGHMSSSEAIDTRELHVRRWADRVRHIPAEVVWQRLVDIEEEGEDGLVTRRVWRTRVFDEAHEYVYQDVAEDYGEKKIAGKKREDGENADTGWIPIETQDLLDADGNVIGSGPMIIDHKVGRCPIVWIPATRTTTGQTGDHDCVGTEKLLDRVDYTASMAVRASNANADPTLAYSDDRAWHAQNRVLAKGHGKMIRTGPEGDVKLLEASGATVEMEWKTHRELKTAVMQTTGAVIIDPEVAGAWAQSGRALSILWRPMEAKSGAKRVPMEDAIEQLAEMWRNIGLALGVSSTEDDDPEGLVLPPALLQLKVASAEGYVVEEQEVDDDKRDVLCVHQVGVGRHVKIVWPPYHDMSPEGFASLATALTGMVGEKPVLSQRSGVTLALQGARLTSDVDAELEQIAVEAAEAMARQQAFVEGGGDAPPPTVEDDEDDPEDADDPKDDEDDDA
jgi:hypothetical protein